MVDASVLSALNTLVTSYLTKKYQLDNLSFTALSTISSYLITVLINHDYSKHINLIDKIGKKSVYGVLSIIGVFLIFVFYKQILRFFSRLSIKQYFKLEIESDRAIEIFTKYTKKYEAMFESPTSSVITQCNSQRPTENIVVNFDDTNLNLKGYYIVTLKDIFDFKNKSDTDKKTFASEKKYVFLVYIEKHPTITTLNYLDAIEKYISEPVELFSV